MDELKIREGKLKSDRIKEYEKLSKRLIVLDTEITMKGYHDGWTLQGLRNERHDVIKKINECIIEKIQLDI